MSTFFPEADPPKAYSYMTHYSFNSPKKLHATGILSHPFNQKIQVFLPTASSPAITSQLIQTLQKDTYYYHAHLPLSLFLSSNFMQFIRNGLIALSVQGGIDTHDVICIDGKGRMILSLTKDTYEQLGLTGVPSKFHPNRHRYVVEIDMLSPAMVPGKRGFDRIKWCFENTLVTVFPMVLASVDGHGVSLPLEFPDTVKAIKMGFKIQCTSLNNIIIPDTRTIRTIGKNNLRWRLNVSGLFEWIGMASIQSDRIVQGDKIDPYLCVYSNPPQANANETPIASRACLIEITGLIPAPSVLHIFELLRSVLNESSPDPELMPEWANFTVWGFQDSPISWRGKEHGHLISGENMYSFFLWSSNISPQGKEHPDTGVYVMFENVAAHDLHS